MTEDILITEDDINQAIEAEAKVKDKTVEDPEYAFAKITGIDLKEKKRGCIDSRFVLDVVLDNKQEEQIVVKESELDTLLDKMNYNSYASLLRENIAVKRKDNGTEFDYYLVDNIEEWDLHGIVLAHIGATVMQILSIFPLLSIVGSFMLNPIFTFCIWLVFQNLFYRDIKQHLHEVCGIYEWDNVRDRASSQFQVNGGDSQ